jgi:phosphoglycerate kinase
VAKTLTSILRKKVPLVQLQDLSKLSQKEIVMLENLRFDSREEDQKETPRRAFAKELAKLGDFYVNNAFASSHRQHASIVDLPSLLPHAAGLDLLEEVTFLSSVREKPKRPVVVILGGVKKGKLEAVNDLLSWVDLILIGGKLAEYPEAKKLKDHRREMAILNKLGDDITIESAEKFVDRVRQAGTIIWTGPLGKVEDPRFEKGTKIFAEAMVESKAFTVIGGGDIEAVLTRFKMVDKIDYVSSGGGAMLAFFAKGDLPGLRALRRK